MSGTDIHVETARLQNEICTYLGMKPELVIFNYSQKEQIVKLDLVTVNPKHEQSFLYSSSRGIDKVDALKKMLEYVLEHHKYENSYTIQWITLGGDAGLNTSYFRAKNMYEALDKFYFGRDIASYKIFSINLNPVS
jgi:hypothetical protein